MGQSYYNVKIGLQNKGKLMTLEQLEKLHIAEAQDAYKSIYTYNEEQKKRIEETGSVSGIKDVLTRELVWDFDCANDVEKARQDTLTLGNRLVEQYGVDPDSIHVYYSGSKGFHVNLPINKSITPDQFKKATGEIAKGLTTYDTVVNDPSRVIRLEYTKHPKTGLFKIPLNIGDVEDMSMDEIKTKAELPTDEFSTRFNPINSVLPESLFAITAKEKPLFVEENPDFDYKNPPKGWRQFKWALAQGWFDSGDRHQALMIVAATCRALGYDKNTTYYICKSALKKQAQRTNTPEFGKEELYTNIIEQSVFSDNWQGGQYGPDHPWVKKYCEAMKFDVSLDKKEAPVVELDDLIGNFIKYSTDFEYNIIKTGIEGLDLNLTLSTSTLNGILGQPGSGKTTVAIEILKNASLNNIPSMFFSLDMGPPLVFSKLVQKETGVDFKNALKLYRENKARRDVISEAIKTKYKNVGFNFRCGLTVSDIRSTIQEQTERTGIKPKLIVIDYLENIAGPYADSTANAGMICNQLKDLATEEEVCILLLLQTQKHSTPDVSDPLLSMKQIKGSSVIEQSCSVVLTLWREGYNPDHISDDKYISFAIVKNRFGPMWKGDFAWDAIRGNIRSLADEEQMELESFKIRKKQEKMNQAKEKAGYSSSSNESWD